MPKPIEVISMQDNYNTQLVISTRRAGRSMAKRIGDPVPNTDKAKVRVFFAEVEGNNESVQEALRTMVSAMSRPVRIISDANGSRAPSGILPHDSPGDVEEILEATADEIPEEVAVPPARAPRGAGKKKDRNAGLILVPDLNFRPEGRDNLKNFIRGKSPKNDIEAALAMVYFMQHEMKIQKVSSNHIYTAFKEVGKPVPTDLKQTVRNVKNSKMWLNFTDLDDVRTTTQGDNFVEHDMGKGE